jgi:D-erythro-7,8-dihydroneopterin triphosphate epimerase
MDRILISDLLVRCIIGIRDEERRDKQDVVINVSLFADLAKPGRSDRIEDAVDYSAVKKRIYHLVENSHFFLIEALAEAVANSCLEPPAVSRVHVRVEKPSALRFARSVGVEIMRERKP